MKIYTPINYQSGWLSDNYPDYNSGNLDAAWDNDVFTTGTFISAVSTLSMSAYSNNTVPDSFIVTDLASDLSSIVFSQTDSIGGSITGLGSYLGPFDKEIVVTEQGWTTAYPIIALQGIIDDLSGFNFYLCKSLELPNFSLGATLTKT